MSFREKFQFYAILSALVIFQACAPNDSFESRALSCDPLSPSSSCSGESKASLFVSIPGVEAGQEYIVVIHAPDFLPVLERNQHEILVTSNIDSNFAPDWEIQQQRSLTQHTSFNHNHSESYSTSTETSHEEVTKDRLSQFYESNFASEDDFKRPNKTDSSAIRNPIFLSDSNRNEIFNDVKFLRQANDPKSPAKEVQNFILHRTRNQFEILFDESLRDDGFRRDSFINHADCIEKQFDWMFEILGKPVDLDRKEAIEILVSNIGNGPSGGKAMGFFNPLDRFFIDDPKSGILGNFAELIYLSPFIRPDMICATAAHELQHLINFDSKVTKVLPSEMRGDLNAPSIYSLSQEHHGLNEAYSHLIELLSGEAKAHVHQILLQILRNPHQATRAIELTGHNIYSNFRTRGLNLLIVLHALKRYGGSLRWEDPKTQKFLQSTIASRETGIKNLANLFKESEDEHLKAFFKAWALALFSDAEASKFLPTDPDSSDNGVQFLNRSDEIKTPEVSERRSMTQNEFHPLEARIPFLQTAQAWQALSHSISMFRMIVPDNYRPDLFPWKLEVRSPSSAVQFFVIRVR